MDIPSKLEIVKRWRKEVCERQAEVDPDDELDWESLWRGFVIGAGRPDLANYNDYMDLGFIFEREI